MTKGNHARSCPTFVSVVLAFALLLPVIGFANGSRLEPGDPSRADEHALWLGQRALAIAAAVRNPGATDAMAAVRELGLDSRYCIMVRGWLAMQLHGDKRIAEAQTHDLSFPLGATTIFW